MLTFRPRGAWAGLCGCPLKQAVQAVEERTVGTVKHEVGLRLGLGEIRSCRDCRWEPCQGVLLQ